MPKHYLAAMLWDLRVQYEDELRTLTDAQRVLSEARDQWPKKRDTAVREITERLRHLQKDHHAVGRLLAEALATAEQTADACLTRRPPVSHNTAVRSSQCKGGTNPRRGLGSGAVRRGTLLRSPRR